jgi:hypothetical protein
MRKITNLKESIISSPYSRPHQRVFPTSVGANLCTVPVVFDLPSTAIISPKERILTPVPVVFVVMLVR